MMNYSKLKFLAVILLSITIYSCSNNDDISDPITLGSNVTVTNTFQSTAFTQGAELAIEDLFHQPAGALAATSSISESVEFPSYLLNLYDIDIDKNSITFELVAKADDATYGDLFRVMEADTYDRYYFTFENAQDINGFTSSNSSVNLRIDSDTVLVVEIGEGYDFKPGQSFTITLN
ncbi:hypothetical protein [Polaribacter butkevichii]|nr:hypothetical protein [Polaribacter butkevichii]